ncbi:hypothetical protein BHE74_00010251 [Ensete ventricosum]|nr:hypothetical protein GW17_00018772 [Ensete ventricosum]RWW81369.1 hypothetical protein BHE74_00010251 [Ensete ventricosum]
MIHLQTSPEGIQSEIRGVTTSSYTITINDIGFLISVSCEPVRSDLARGPIVISDYIGPIVPEYLDLTIDDVGECIELVYTPVRKDGTTGTPRIIISDTIVPGRLGISLEARSAISHGTTHTGWYVPVCHRSVTADFDRRHPLKGGISLAVVWLQRTRRKKSEKKREKKMENQEIRRHSLSMILIRHRPPSSDAVDEEKTYTPVRSDAVVGELKLSEPSEIILPGMFVLCCWNSFFPCIPKIDKLEIEGRGYHTNLYAVRGIYSGGKEGKSRIQWLRSMVGTEAFYLTIQSSIVFVFQYSIITGETSRMYEANVDDVGYRLVAVYTPVREDGVEGQPVSASTDPISVGMNSFRLFNMSMFLVRWFSVKISN